MEPNVKNKERIFITGATGFLGSHVARSCVNAGYEVYALRRKSSGMFRCNDFAERVGWVCLDDVDWEKKVQACGCTVFIHAAWLGVDAASRNDWQNQLQNLEFIRKILEMATNAEAGVKFIGFGSQAEYGVFSEKIKESAPTVPTSAYGAVKCACADITRIMCSINSEHRWYWLRLFTFFGEGEADNWLIPSLVKNMLTKKSMDLTPGEQRYAYLYVKDLADAILQIIEKECASGVYNVSSSNPISLKVLATKIRDCVNPSFQLNFGALPYRPQQPMHIEGDTTKFQTGIGAIDDSDFEKKLFATVDYYKRLYGAGE